jgi:hypothetical protein
MSKQIFSTAAGHPLAAPHHITIATRYANVPDFIHGFCRSVDERHMMVGLMRAHEVGTRVEFAVCLADGRAAFRGSGTVVNLVTATKRAGVYGVKIELGPLDGESHTMRRCLLMARQALLLAQAADTAAFDGAIPEYARAVLPRITPDLPSRALASGTQPQARTLVAIGEERDVAPESTQALTQVAGVIHVPPPRPPLRSVADEADAVTAVTPQMAVPEMLAASEDVASAAPVLNLFAPVDTARVSLLDPPLPAKGSSPWGLVVGSLLLAGGMFLAYAMGAF